MSARIEGVLFDSGGVLVGPVGGRWNPRQDFEEVVLRHAPRAPVSRFEEVFAAGHAFLSHASVTPSRDDYHRHMLALLGIDPTPELLADLTAPLDRPAVEPYAEVPGVVGRLAELGVKLAIVTDNWGTSEAFLAGSRLLGPPGFEGFDACVVSSELGVRKPHPLMYRTASDALGLEARACLFVDDDPLLVAAAITLGYHGLAVIRSSDSPPPDVPWARTTEAVVDIVISSDV